MTRATIAAHKFSQYSEELDCVPDGRKRHFHAHAWPVFLDADAGAMQIRDRRGQRQAKPMAGLGPACFAAVKAAEQPFMLLDRHAGAVVADPRHDLVACVAR